MHSKPSRFGFAFPRREGCPSHPDDPLGAPAHWSDEKYLATLQDYHDATGCARDCWTSRPHLLEKLKDPTINAPGRPTDGLPKFSPGRGVFGGDGT